MFSHIKSPDFWTKNGLLEQCDGILQLQPSLNMGYRINFEAMQHCISYLNTEFDTTTIYASLVLVGYRCMFNMETFQIVVGLLYTKIRYIEIHFQVYIQNPYLALKKLAINYILSGQKFIKNAKNGQFWRVFEKESLLSYSVTRHVNFNRIKIGRKYRT